jgi:CheY-like chemotaxis protein
MLMKIEHVCLCALHASCGKTPPMRLLIVEDNLEMRRLIVHVVRKLSDAIFECEDGAEALSAYREHLPDWVLMDIEMPKTGRHQRHP